MENTQVENRTYTFSTIDPLTLYGVNNQRYNLLVRHFPHVRLVARGDTLYAEGLVEHLESFEETLSRVVAELSVRKQMTKGEFEYLLQTPFPSAESVSDTELITDIEEDTSRNENDVLVMGPRGRVVRAITPSQHELVQLSHTHDLLLALGAAGSGKTYIAIALAVRALRMREVRRLILTRPAVEAGERLGFLPGDLREKLDPYLQPLYDALNDMLPPRFLQSKLEEGVVQIAPLAYMRGRTLDHAFVILDEAQNATLSQLKMFLTRMGRNSKFILTGDPSQVDLPQANQSGLERVASLLTDIPGVATVRFHEHDIVRHPIVRAVVKAFRQMEGEA